MFSIKMVSTRFLYRLLGKLLISVTILLIFFNEFAVYTLNQNFWNEIECLSDNCTRILLVADPQLLGEDSDQSIYSTLAILDSDRYLRKTFNRAVKFSQPHIVCFLGDLLDEGSIASPEQYRNYIQRFQNIFNVERSIKVVHVPGDNDIGGDNGEYISNSNVRRFEIEFTNDDITDYDANQLRFFKINRMMLDFTNPDIQTNNNKIRIGLSHMPVLNAGGPLLRNILKEIDPHVLFTGHLHESRIFLYPSSGPIDFYDKRIETFDLDRLKMENQYLEIMVPTSSYRMGKYKIGYGLAVIEKNTLKYTVLWTLSRFIFIKLYITWILLFIILVLILQFGMKCPTRLSKRQHFERMSYIPHF